MQLIHHDTTGTQTDCPKPLSRKKLRQLMRHNHMALTSGALANQHGRLTLDMRVTKREREREERRQSRLTDAERQREAEKRAEAELFLSQAILGNRPNIFKRLAGMFAELPKHAAQRKRKVKA